MSKKSILIVDDNFENVKLLGSLLEEMNYEIIIATNGGEALKILSSSTLDLILLDIMMPDMSGFEVCKKLKSNEVAKDIPVIFLSALHGIEDKIEAFRVGGVDYITKPFQIEEVKARIITHLELSQKREELLSLNKKLENSHLLLKNLLKEAPGVIYMYKYFPNGKSSFPFVSDKILDVYELSVDEVKNDASKIFSKIHKDDLEMVTKSILESFNSLNRWECIYRVELPSKGLRWLKAEANPQKQDDGSVIWYGYVYDYTEQKKLEDELLKRKNQIESSADISGIGFWEIDLKTLTITFDDLSFKLYGTTKEIEGGYSFSWEYFLNKFLDEKNRDILNGELSKVYQNENNYSSRFKYRARKANGGSFYVLVDYRIEYDNKNPNKAYGTNFDITEQIELQNSLKKLNKNLEKRVEEETKKRLKNEKLLIQQSKMAEMGEMMGAIAHQWRQPLNALALLVQKVKYMYKREKLDEARIDEIQTNSMEHIRFMSKTIDDFRNFFKPEKTKEKFLLEDALDEVINILSAQFKIYSIEIKSSNLKEIEIYGFKNEFKQVLLNILNNSKDAILEKKVDGKIEISGKINNFIKLEIKDNGGGIKSEIVDKIFNPYFTTKEESGTGIGLYMSKMIIENSMSGELNVQNVDDGAKFTIKLPLFKE